MGALLVLGPRVLPEYRDPDAGRLDLVSAGQSVVALLAVVFGLKELAAHGIGVLPVVAVLGGVAVGALWVRRQRRLADPMIDVALFRLAAFRTALAVNFLSIFVMVGYFLFIGQYLQLVIGMSPLEAGLWSLPGAVAFVAASQLAPRVLGRVRASHVVAGGLAASAAGLLLLASVQVQGGLTAIVAASVVISLGMGPVFGLTTEMVVGAAPPERAGAASGISETAAELGGALGLAVLGSVGVAIYRAGIDAGFPGAPEAARDTLGGAVAVAGQVPGGAELLTVAQGSFVAGLQLTSVIAAGIAAAIAVVAAVALREPAPEPAADPAVCPA
jgi:DHA2 family multidrug resistance protein-like MFS transporter